MILSDLSDLVKMTQASRGLSATADL